MSDADGSPVDVDLAGIKTQELDVGEDDHTESLVDFKHRDILVWEAGKFQGLKTRTELSTQPK